METTAPGPRENTAATTGTDKNDLMIGLGIGVTVFVAYLIGLQQGHAWGGDFAQYILHARNLVEGIPYADTGYLYNPNLPVIAPPSYPPGLPILLSVVYRVTGSLDIELYKLVPLASAGMYAALLYVLCRQITTRFNALLTTTFFVFSPWFWVFKDFVTSEFPAWSFLAISLILYGRLKRGPPHWKSFGLGGLLAISVYMAYATRTTSIVLVPALLVCELLDYRRVRVPMIFAFTVALGLMVFQELVVPVWGGYAAVADVNGSGGNLLRFLGNVRANLRDFPIEMFGGLTHPGSAGTVIDGFLVALVIAMAAIGAPVLVKSFRTPFVVFGALFFAAHLLLPRAVMGTRYILPSLPLMVLSSFVGVGWIAARFPPGTRTQRALALTVPLCLAGLFIGGHVFESRWEFDGPHRPEAQELFAFVTEETPESARLAFGFPREMALYTGRATTALHRGDPAAIAAYVDSVSVDYLVDDQLGAGRFSTHEFIGSATMVVDTVFANDRFRVLRVVR